MGKLVAYDRRIGLGGWVAQLRNYWMTLSGNVWVAYFRGNELIT